MPMATYEKRRAAGLCPECGKIKSARYVSCYKCRQKRRRYRRKRLADNPRLRRTHKTYHRRRAAGLCPECGGKRDTNYLVCSTCLDKRRERRLKRIADGLCTVCGSPAASGYALCRRCHHNDRDRQRVKRNAINTLRIQRSDKKAEYLRRFKCKFCDAIRARGTGEFCTPCQSRFKKFMGAR